MNDFIAKLSFPGDIFLTEGFTRKDEIHCSTLGYYANNPHKGSGVTKKQSSHPLRHITKVNKEALKTQVHFRNKSAVATFNFFHNHSAIKFAKLGRAHLLSDEQPNFFTPNHVVNTKKHPEGELIESL